jgi:hypothetical protein
VTAPLGAAALPTLVALLTQPRASLAAPDGPASLLDSSAASFREAVLEALLQARGEAGDPPAGMAGADAGPAAGIPTRPPALPPGGEAETIGRQADRTGVDPALLVALRQTENGGRGREFGVLATPASGLEDQARIAANSVRNSLARFTRQGGTAAIDPTTGRYSEAFLRFFSARYAPIGAANDPAGLNRFHARNLIALYAAQAPGQSGGVGSGPTRGGGAAPGQATAQLKEGVS